MACTTLVGTDVLAQHLDDPGWMVFDCRHDLAQPGAGIAEHARSHVPGAHFLHLDRDLASPPDGRNGRHPLPDPDRLASTLRALGLSRVTQAVAYDAQGGAFAARLWWLLRWMGHDAVAVLDGGWQKWLAESRPVTSQPASRSSGDFRAALRGGRLGADEVLQGIGSLTLLDARAPDRYRGENETLDPVGGRIPGALNRFYRDNLGADGRFKQPGALRADFERVLGGRDPGNVVHYCGSGVTACHNLLAMSVAGYAPTRLYAGSWSEWSSDPARPVERG
jgi:thiosulfate/3-mercaptopyruvate sulfurtransferase